MIDKNDTKSKDIRSQSKDKQLEMLASMQKMITTGGQALV